MRTTILTLLLLLTFNVNAEVFKCDDGALTDLQDFPCGEQRPVVEPDEPTTRVFATLYTCGDNPVTLQNFPCDEEPPKAGE